jgi:hypothetical protein
MIVGVMIIIFFSLSPAFNDWSFKIKPELSGQFGNLIGGIVGSLFSLSAALLLYKTLMTQIEVFTLQKRELDIQIESNMIERFETTFFNLLTNHNDIKSSIRTYVFSLSDDLNVAKYNADGCEFFAFAKVEIKNLWESLDSDTYLGTYNSDRIETFYNEIENLRDPSSSNYAVPQDFDNDKSTLINIEKLKYSNLFYGVTKEIWGEARELNTFDRINFVITIFFKKYNYAIGHYFRHLYNVIDYTNNYFQSNTQLNVNKAKKYIDFLKVQMSTYELMLVFYNLFLFPEFVELLIKFSFFENLTIEDLIHQSHNCVSGLNLKCRDDVFRNLNKSL